MSEQADICVRLRRGFGGLVPPICDESANTIAQLREMSAELLAALKYSHRFLDAFSIEQDTKYVAAVIAKAEELK